MGQTTILVTTLHAVDSKQTDEKHSKGKTLKNRTQSLYTDTTQYFRRNSWLHVYFGNFQDCGRMHPFNAITLLAVNGTGKQSDAGVTHIRQWFNPPLPASVDNRLNFRTAGKWKVFFPITSRTNLQIRFILSFSFFDFPHCV